MRIVMFYHSIISGLESRECAFSARCWSRGHQVFVYEPKDCWSLRNLIQEKGEIVLRKFRKVYPHLHGNSYETDLIDLDMVLVMPSF